MEQSLVMLLRRVIPFRFLALEQKQALARRLEKMTFHSGQIIIHQDDPQDRAVYLIESGSVDVCDNRRGTMVRVSTIYS
ncbi:MAG: hypothetical protein D6B26_04975, partial [Spirochaetaceae bacterium]